MRRTTRREFVKAGVAGALGLGIGSGAAVTEVIGERWRCNEECNCKFRSRRARGHAESCPSKRGW